jgi:hypothetical protein
MNGARKILSFIWNIIGTALVIVLSPILFVVFFIEDQIIPNWK